MAIQELFSMIKMNFLKKYTFRNIVDGNDYFYITRNIRDVIIGDVIQIIRIKITAAASNDELYAVDDQPF